MADTKIDAATTTNLTGTYPDFSVQKAEDPTTKELGDTFYMVDWPKWLGYYEQVPELAAVIDKKALWTVGRGFTTDANTRKTLEKIKGSGKDNFNNMMYNANRTYTIGGDYYAEQIRDKAKRLINLKTLNPGSIQVVSDEFGMLKRYDQIWQGQVINTWKPNEIFHLAWNRIVDANNGISTIAKLVNIILMRNESMDDQKILFHRYVKPLWVFTVDTDDTTEIANFKAKVDATVKNAENMIVPKETVANIERVSIPQYSTLDPIPWLKLLQEFFIQAEGVPEIALGSGRETTEASAKILYLAFEQMIKWNQLFLESELKSQLGIKIKFKFPASIEPSLLGDTKKDPKLNKEGVDPGKDQK